VEKKTADNNKHHIFQMPELFLSSVIELLNSRHIFFVSQSLRKNVLQITTYMFNGHMIIRLRWQQNEKKKVHVYKL